MVSSAITVHYDLEDAHMPGPAGSPNTLNSTRISLPPGTFFAKSTPLLDRQRLSTTADLPADWLAGGSDPATLLARIAPTRRDMVRLHRAHELVGALFGSDRRRVWLVTPLPDREQTPLDYLAAHGPAGWDELLRGLLGAMQGGSYASEADRNWATERLAGHRLVIRRSQPT